MSKNEDRTDRDRNDAASFTFVFAFCGYVLRTKTDLQQNIYIQDESEFSSTDEMGLVDAVTQ